VNQNTGKIKENFKLQNAIISKLIDIGRKNFIFITHPDSVGLQNVIKIQGGHVNYCADLT
jgi:hypothetical protein